MKKIQVILLTLVFSILLAGIYGVIHDQITYTISSEYYTKFKFIQFNIAPEIRLNERLGAGLVGFLATWWTGIPIGVLLGVFGVWKPATIFKFSIKKRAVFVAMLTVIIFGLVGFIHGAIYTSSMENWPMHIYTRNEELSLALGEVVNWDSFRLVAFIHNYGYIGGLVGLIVGCLFQHRKFKRMAINNQID